MIFSIHALPPSDDGVLVEILGAKALGERSGSVGQDARGNRGTGVPWCSVLLFARTCSAAVMCAPTQAEC